MRPASCVPPRPSNTRVFCGEILIRDHSRYLAAKSFPDPAIICVNLWRYQAAEKRCLAYFMHRAKSPTRLGYALDALSAVGQKLSFFGSLLTFVGILGLLILVPYFFARAVLQWTQTALPTLAHAVVLLAFFLALGYWAWMISGERGSQLFRRLNRQGVKWPFLFSIALLLFSVLCFASLSSTLNDHGLIRFEPAIARGEFWRFQDFYMWHFLNSIPGLNLTETLKLTHPYDYKDSLSGALLLCFKLIVIVPVIASFTLWNRIRKEHARRDADNLHM
jgi:hypothetical protein